MGSNHFTSDSEYGCEVRFNAIAAGGLVPILTQIIFLGVTQLPLSTRVPTFLQNDSSVVLLFFLDNNYFSAMANDKACQPTMSNL